MTTPLGACVYSIILQKLIGQRFCHFYAKEIDTFGPQFLTLAYAKSKFITSTYVCACVYSIILEKLIGQRFCHF
jgi:hypothetical protein